MPLNSARIKDSPTYVSKTVLEGMTASRMSREEVISSLGQPYVENPESRGIAYFNCVDTDERGWIMVLLVPIPTFDEVSDRSCQAVGIWFDPDGRVSKTASYIEYRDASAEADQYPDYTRRHEELRTWLSKRGGT